MDKPDKTHLQLLTVDDPRFAATIERRIGEMRHLLEAMKQPVSPTIALRTLREAFPDSPLEERVKAAITTRRHH
jgi:hypothetical protein